MNFVSAESGGGNTTGAGGQSGAQSSAAFNSMQNQYQQM